MLSEAPTECWQEGEGSWAYLQPGAQGPVSGKECASPPELGKRTEFGIFNAR